MTDGQQKILTDFETRVRQLMLLCETLKKENQLLTEQLEQQQATLNESKKNAHDLAVKYDNLKLAKMISFGKSDIKEARQQLSGLVREIDACIALIKQ